MPEQKRILPLFGKEIEVSEVPIAKATEFFNEYELEDGSVIKVKSVATSIMRVNDQTTPDGQPIYLVLTSPNVSVISSKLAKHNEKSH